MEPVTSDDLLRLAYRQWRSEHPEAGYHRHAPIEFTHDAERVAFQVDREQ